MALSLPRLTRWRRKPATEASATVFRDEDDVVRRAVFEHEARLLREGQGARDVLAALVKAILLREPDTITHVPWLEDPVALVSGVVFRGEAEDPYSLKGGWLCVAYEGRTGALGWHQVNSVDHLGELAMRYRFRRWAPS